MTCPHCLVKFYVKSAVDMSDPPDPRRYDDGYIQRRHLGGDADSFWYIDCAKCPACEKFIIDLISRQRDPLAGTHVTRRVWPKVPNRSPIPPEVPDEFRRDYLEACLILVDSPNASAALSRRCLQLILREKVGAPKSTLQKEIQWAIESGGLPSSVIDLLDVPRTVGNRAAHPTLSDAGAIVDVEPWEAEWCLEVIEALYDYVFVVPARNRERLERLERAREGGAQPHAERGQE